MRALGGSTPDTAAQPALVTIGHKSSGRRRAAASVGVTELDTVDDMERKENWEYIPLEDRLGHTDTGAEQWAADAVAQLELQQRQVGEGQTSTPNRRVARREGGEITR